MRDHVSTGGTLGLGLPGTKRLVDEFEIRSEEGVGTWVRIAKYR
jgi:serine/threonine-protein kinase RsbT